MKKEDKHQKRNDIMIQYARLQKMGHADAAETLMRQFREKEKHNDEQKKIDELLRKGVPHV